MERRLGQRKMPKLLHLFGGTENDTFNFTGDVRDSSIVGGFGVDSLVAMPQATSFVEPLFMVGTPDLMEVRTGWG